MSIERPTPQLQPVVSAPQDRSAWARIARALARLIERREERRVSDPRTIH